MSLNMSNVDRKFRSLFVAPAAIVIAILAGPLSLVGVVLVALAAIMLATSAVGFCPLYRLLHVGYPAARRPAAALRELGELFQ